MARRGPWGPGVCASPLAVFEGTSDVGIEGAQRVAGTANEPVVAGSATESRTWLGRESVRYTLAVLGYIALIGATKDFLTFTWGVFYFVTVLEVLPRCVRRIRAGWGADRRRPEANEVAAP
jgi:hypothetical protein